MALALIVGMAFAGIAAPAYADTLQDPAAVTTAAAPATSDPAGSTAPAGPAATDPTAPAGPASSASSGAALSSPAASSPAASTDAAAAAPPADPAAPQAVSLASGPAAPAAAAPTNAGAPVVGVTKTLVSPGPFNPGDVFQYRIQYTCSSLETACPNATITDQIPSQVSFVTSTTTGDPSTITYDATTRQLKVVFTSIVDGSGTPGLIPGHNGQFLVSVKFPTGTPDGTTAHNCAVITADAATTAESCVDASAKTVPTYGVNLTKGYVTPATGNGPTSGVQGTGATTTLNLSATVAGNQAANTLTVADPDPDATNAFDSFNFTGFTNALSLPTGIKAQIQVKSTTNTYQTVGTYVNGDTVTLPGSSGIGNGSVTGTQLVYSCASPAPSGSVCTADGRIPVGQALDVKAGLQLRTTLRSDSDTQVPVGTVPNQAKATSTYPDHAPETDVATADYTVTTPTATVQATKTISPTSAQQQSGATVTMTVAGKNTGNIPANGMVVTDPDPDGLASAFNTFTFAAFKPLSLPAGVTADVKVTVDGTTWTTIGTGLNSVDTPSLGSISAPSVRGVQYVYTGTIPPQTTISNSFTTTLKDSVAAGALTPANCDQVTMSTNSGTVQGNACANFTVTPITTSITVGKSFSPISGTAQTGPATTVTLSGENTSNVPITSFQLVDPGTGSVATFDSFDVTGFGKISAPSGTTWKVEVKNSAGNWVDLTANPYDAGATPSTSDLPSGVTAGSVQGVRYTLASGSIPANTRAISTTVGLQLRNTSRSTTAPIEAGTVNNCATVSSGSLTASTCAKYTINKPDLGTGIGASKTISPNSVVQGSGTTSTITLKAANNDANVPADTIVIEDSPATAPAFWNSFSLTAFQASALPSGTTSLKVEYWNGSSWKSVGTYNGTGTVTPTLPMGVSATDVHGVRYTWTGSFPAKATGFTAPFTVSLNDATQARVIQDCLLQTYSGTLINPPVAASACANIAVTAQSRTVDQSKSFNPATGTLGLTPPVSTTATLQVKNTSNVPVQQIVVADPSSSTTPFNEFNLTGFGTVSLPSNVQAMIKVSTDGGATYTTIGSYINGQTVTVPSGVTLADVTAVSLAFSGTGSALIPANSARMSVGLKLQLRSTNRTTYAPVDTTAIQNCFTTTSDAGVTFTGNPCATFTPAAQSPGVSALKTWIPDSGVRDELPTSTITIGGRNSGNVPVDSLVLQDPATPPTPISVDTNAFDAFTVTGFSGLVMPQSANQVQIDVLTADGRWHNGVAAAGLPTGTAVNGVALGDIVGVRATFSNSNGTSLPVVTDASKTGDIGINVILRATLRSTRAPIVVQPGGSTTVGNQSNALVVYQNTPGTPAVASANYTVTSGSVTVAPDKSIYPAGSPTTVNPNQTVIYQLQIKNSGDRNLVAPVVLDTFDSAQLGYDATQSYPAGSYQFEQNGSLLTGSGLIVDSSTAGQVRFAFAAGDSLAPGQTAYLRVVMTTKPGLPAGMSITNTYGITWDVAANGPVNCTSGSSGQFDGDATWCTASTTVKVQTADSMAAVKWVQGDTERGFTNIVDPSNTNCPVSDGYTHYPCIAHTHDSGIFSYNLDVTVSGNVPESQARLIDVLPHVGDTGVILTGQDRGTALNPTFQTPVTVSGLPTGTTYTLYYANTYTPSTATLTSPAFTQSWGSDWSTSDFGAGTKAIGIDVQTADGAPLPPASTFTLHWQMQAPSTAPAAGSIAWNSFAFTGAPTDGSGWLLAAEPRKVGIDLVNPSVQVQKTTIPTSADGTFGFTLTPVGDATGGGTEQLTTNGGAGSTTPWNNLTPGGTYQLTEATTGDAADFVAGQITCVDSRNGNLPVATTPVENGVQFTALGSAAIVCSLANTKRPSITVSKTAIGGNGTFDFTLAGDGGSTTPVTTRNGSGSYMWGPADITPGTSYTLSEKTQPGWTSSFSTCTGVEPTSHTNTSVTFTADPGASIDCSFTNTIIPPAPGGLAYTGSSTVWGLGLGGGLLLLGIAVRGWLWQRRRRPNGELE